METQEAKTPEEINKEKQVQKVEVISFAQVMGEIEMMKQRLLGEVFVLNIPKEEDNVPKKAK